MLPIYTNLFYAVLFYMFPASIENVNLFQDIPLRKKRNIHGVFMIIY